MVQLYGPTSLSGRERNHLFISQQGRRFTDVSSLSGLDHPGDSRAFALLDFDRDGWLDVALVNANAPLLQLFHNRIGLTESAGMVALRFVGGHHTDTPDSGLSNRDGYGATVTLDLGDLEILREHRAGEGFAAQNSAAMHIGLGQRRDIDTLVVRWPSGLEQETSAVPAGTLVTAYEDPTQSPNGQAFTFETYAAPAIDSDRPSAQPVERLRLAERLDGPDPGGLKMFTTMATWCPACKRELPRLRRLRSRLGPEALEMFGVPVDAGDSREMLEAYLAEQTPVYRLLLDLTSHEVADVKAMISEALYDEPLPSTLITDGQGHLLHVVAGVPTVSDLRRLLALQ